MAHECMDSNPFGIFEAILHTPNVTKHTVRIQDLIVFTKLANLHINLSVKIRLR